MERLPCGHLDLGDSWHGGRPVQCVCEWLRLHPPAGQLGLWDGSQPRPDVAIGDADVDVHDGDPTGGERGEADIDVTTGAGRARLFPDS